MTASASRCAQMEKCHSHGTTRNVAAFPDRQSPAGVVFSLDVPAAEASKLGQAVVDVGGLGTIQLGVRGQDLDGSLVELLSLSQAPFLLMERGEITSATVKPGPYGARFQRDTDFR